MANFEGNVNLNAETSEIEIEGKFALTNEELEQVTGGLQGENPRTNGFRMLRQLLEIVFAPI